MLAKSEVGFEHPAKGPDHCGECRHFRSPDGCAIVRGVIAAGDWCRRFRHAAKGGPMAERKHKWNPGGDKGKLHRELGIPEGETIPATRLAAATHSRDPEIRRDAIRAKTMKGWHHDGAARRYKRMRG